MTMSLNQNRSLFLDEEEQGKGESEQLEISFESNAGGTSSSSSSVDHFNDEDGTGTAAKAAANNQNRRKKMIAAGVACVLLLFVLAAIACIIPLVVQVATKTSNNGVQDDNETPVPAVVQDDNATPVPAVVQDQDDTTSAPQDAATGTTSDTTIAPQDTATGTTSDTTSAPQDASKEETSAVTGNIPFFSKDVIAPYDTREALEEDLLSVASEMTRNLIVQNAQKLSPSATNASATDASTRRLNIEIAQQSRSVNQESDVDEADSIKEDGTFVYSAYGDHLVVWDRQGQMITAEKMPTPYVDEFGFHNTPWIQAVQLTQNHVLVFAGGYGVSPEASMTAVQNETMLQVYTKPTVEEPVLALVATETINGHYVSSRYLEDTQSVHVVSGNDINVKQYLRDPLDPFTNPAFQGLNLTQYIEKAELIAFETVVPVFVTRLAEELIKSNQGELPPMMQVNAWNLVDYKSPDIMNPTATLDESLRAYVEILSLNPSALPTAAFFQDSLTVSRTGFLGPSAYPFVQAADDSIIINVERFDYIEDTNTATTSIFLLHYKVTAGVGEGETKVGTSLSAVAALPGQLLNQHSVDIQGDDLRVAVTLPISFPHGYLLDNCGAQPQPQPTLLGQATDECLTADNWNACHDLVVMEGCMTVDKTGCPYTFSCAEETPSGESSTENYVVVYDLGSTGDMIERGRVSFGHSHETISSLSFGETFLYVTTTLYSEDGPFHVIDMPLGQAPSLRSSFELDIVPTYLQSLNKDGTLVVGIGQNSTGKLINKVLDGVMVHVYDITKSEQPVVVASRKLNDDPLFGSQTVSSYDPKTVQYTDSGLLVIPLTLTADIMAIYAQATATNTTFSPLEYMNGGFEGFVVLDIANAAKEGITELVRINHLSATGSCNHCTGVLPNHRSFVYQEDGSVMTVQNHMVASTDLTTLEQTWVFNVTFEGLDSSCCF